MPASKGGRTLQDCYDSLGTLVKRKCGETEPSNAKRRRVLQEQLPLLMLQRAIANNKDDNTRNQTKQQDFTQTTEPKSHDNLTVEYIQEQRTLVQQDTQRLEEKRKAFFQKQSDLVGVYMYGLEKISKLTDLRDSPDAILPGNQV
jgi:hypothetical protein